MMMDNDSLTLNILVIMYFGDVVFAVSGALIAARHKMDIIGFIMIGTITNNQPMIMSGQLYATGSFSAHREQVAN